MAPTGTCVAMRGESSSHLNPLGRGEKARFFSVDPVRALECLSARFVDHVYAPHTHESFVVGTIVAGRETFRIGGSRHFAGPGDLCLIDPGIVHDGEPAGAGYAYRMAYPSIELLQEVAADALERPVGGTVHFREPIVSDHALARAFAAVHRLAENGGDALAIGERLHGFFICLLARHSARNAPFHGALDRPAAREEGPVARVLDYVDAHFAEPLDLATLSQIAGLPRTRLIRTMRRQTGLTPYAWVADRRVRAARAMLARDRPPAEVAAACGFYDQSHLNRAFKARIGVPPGAFRASRPFPA